jgi:hypothetical protein
MPIRNKIKAYPNRMKYLKINGNEINRHLDNEQQGVRPRSAFQKSAKAVSDGTEKQKKIIEFIILLINYLLS